MVITCPHCGMAGGKPCGSLRCMSCHLRVPKMVSRTNKAGATVWGFPSDPDWAERWK